MGLFKKSKKDENKYKLSMNKTRKGVFANLKRIFSSSKYIDDDFFEELEETLIMADIGIKTVFKFIDAIKKEVKEKKIIDPSLLKNVIIDKMIQLYNNNENTSNELFVNENNLTIYLFVGVNGVGKTTTIGKLANILTNDSKKVMLAAGDTFRAGAVEQLEIWAKRTNSLFIKKDNTNDPSSVIFEAITKAKEEKCDFLLCDTAGRLQNKVNLMKELEKIKRVISREVPNAPHETLLVLDATTGQNGMNQAKAFLEATDVSGVVLTKLDGTAKGGIVLAIHEEFNIPIKFSCLGEGIDDIEYFDIEQYINGLFADLLEE